MRAGSTSPQGLWSVQRHSGGTAQAAACAGRSHSSSTLCIRSKGLEDGECTGALLAPVLTATENYKHWCAMLNSLGAYLINIKYCTCAVNGERRAVHVQQYPNLFGSVPSTLVKVFTPSGVAEILWVAEEEDGPTRPLQAH